MEWINDCEFKCNDCDTIFKVYYRENGGDTNFCPNCASRDFDELEEQLFMLED